MLTVWGNISAQMSGRSKEGLQGGPPWRVANLCADLHPERTRVYALHAKLVFLPRTRWSVKTRTWSTTRKLG